jgi:hypothetical protein
MTPKKQMLWFSVASALMLPIGLFFGFAGLGVLPVEKAVLPPWQNGVYAATFMGWGATLFFAGRLALERSDRELMKGLLYGMLVWFAVEVSFSIFFGVWFNVVVDVAVFAILSVPLISAIRSHSEDRHR